MQWEITQEQYLLSWGSDWSPVPIYECSLKRRHENWITKTFIESGMVKLTVFLATIKFSFSSPRTLFHHVLLKLLTGPYRGVIFFFTSQTPCYHMHSTPSTSHHIPLPSDEKLSFVDCHVIMASTLNQVQKSKMKNKDRGTTRV